MTFNPQKQHRRSIRLKGYDYTSAGFYFITICVHERECLSEKIADKEVILNRYGQIAYDEWENTATIRQNVALDVFVIMPNHVHGIIIIHDNNCRGTVRRAQNPGTGQTGTGQTGTGQTGTGQTGTGHRAPTDGTFEQFGKPVSNSIPTIIRSYKATATKQINQLRGTPGVRVWQRNYYEHIIRDEKGLYNIRQYIENNPLHWAFDRENINDKSLEEKKRYWKQFFENLKRKTM